MKSSWKVQSLLFQGILVGALTKTGSCFGLLFAALHFRAIIQILPKVDGKQSKSRRCIAAVM